jgi:hypothetical protein
MKGIRHGEGSYGADWGVVFAPPRGTPGALRCGHEVEVRMPRLRLLCEDHEDRLSAVVVEEIKRLATTFDRLSGASSE